MSLPKILRDRATIASGKANKATTISGYGITDANIKNGVITLGSNKLTPAPLASPAFTGTPTAPTAAAGTNTTQLATTEFAAIAALDKIDSSRFVLAKTAPDTPVAGTFYFLSDEFKETVKYTGSESIYIAYDAGENDAEYVFYDGDGNVVTPIVGAAFTSYTITGTPSKDRFYCVPSLEVFNWSNLDWSTDVAYENIGTSTDFGAGKTNTTLGKATVQTDGSSIFYAITSMNDDNEYGYNDWYVPSSSELQKIRDATSGYTLWYETIEGDFDFDLGTSEFKHIYVYSSSESGDVDAYCWDVSNSEMTTFSKGYFDNSGVVMHMLPVRSF